MSPIVRIKTCRCCVPETSCSPPPPCGCHRSNHKENHEWFQKSNPVQPDITVETVRQYQPEPGSSNGSCPPYLPPQPEPRDDSDGVRRQSGQHPTGNLPPAPEQLGYSQ